jgi:cell division protein YceG involved in septum cleavage
MRKRWVWLGLLAALLLVGGGAGGWFYLQTRPVSRAFQPQLVRLKEPMDADALAERLHQRKLIRNPRLLAWLLRWRGKPTVAAGDYEFSPNQSLLEIADILVHERFTRNWVTIPEGWTLARIAERLHERGVADKDEFLALCRQPQQFKDIDMPLARQPAPGGLPVPQHLPLAARHRRGACHPRDAKRHAPICVPAPTNRRWKQRGLNLARATDNCLDD